MPKAAKGSRAAAKGTKRPRKAPRDPPEAQPPEIGAESEEGEPVLIWCGRCKHFEASFLGDHQCRKAHDLTDLAFIRSCPDRDDFPATEQRSYDLSE